jgi:hypothetical protein
MKTFTTFALLACLTSTAAAETDVVVHVGSHHVDRSRNWNETNAGLGVRRTFDNNAFVEVGAYKNSFYRNSVYTLIGYQPVVVGPIKAGLASGLATGYGYAAVPIVATAVDLKIGSGGVRMIATPTVTRDGKTLNYGAVAFSVTKPF